LNAHFLAQRRLALEQFADDCPAQQTDFTGVADVTVGEWLALVKHLPVADLVERWCRAENKRRHPVAVAVHDLCSHAHLRGNAGHRSTFAGDRLGILRCKGKDGPCSKRRAAAGSSARLNDEVVRAHAGYRSLHGNCRPKTDVDHGNHGGYANYDAEGGQCRAQGVAPQCAKCNPKRAKKLADHHGSGTSLSSTADGTNTRSSSDSITPSRMWMMRSA
jgi:hypothetical protein